MPKAVSWVFLDPQTELPSSFKNLGNKEDPAVLLHRSENVPFNPFSLQQAQSAVLVARGLALHGP